MSSGDTSDLEEKVEEKDKEVEENDDINHFKKKVEEIYGIKYDKKKYTLLDVVDKNKDEKNLLYMCYIIYIDSYINNFNHNVFNLTIYKYFFKKIVKNEFDLIIDNDNYFSSFLEDFKKNKDFSSLSEVKKELDIDINLFTSFILFFYVKKNIPTLVIDKTKFKYNSLYEECIYNYIDKYDKIIKQEILYISNYIFFLISNISKIFYSLIAVEKIENENEYEIIYKITKQLYCKLNAINDTFIKLFYLYILLIFSNDDAIKLNFKHIFNKITIINKIFEFNDYYKDNIVFIDAAGYDFMIKQTSSDKANGVSGSLFDLLNKKFKLDYTDNIPDNEITKKFLNISVDKKGDNGDGDINIYTKNETGAYFHTYVYKDTKQKLNVIHAVGPNFNQQKYKDLLGKTNIQKEKKCKDLLLKIYKDIFKVVKNNDHINEVILAPLSSGIFAGEFNDLPYNYNYITSITPDIILQAINEVYIGAIFKIPEVKLHIKEKKDYNRLKTNCPYYSFEDNAVLTTVKAAEKKDGKEAKEAKEAEKEAAKSEEEGRKKAAEERKAEERKAAEERK